MKNMHKFLGVILACTMMFSLCACWDAGYGENYIIQYTDDAGTHSLLVAYGMPYALDTIPTRVGYDFMGLYDAEIGGTQYISSTGSSLSTFGDKKNMVLFPQFRAKEFTLILDYQGAAVTGSRFMKVAYDSEISELPLNLILEHKDFQGWYTEPSCKGNQIADQYGVLPENRKVTENLFDLSDPDGNIKLYAGFQWEEFTVTFYAQDENSPKVVKVPYGTALDEVKPNIIVDNKMVISWSKRKNDINKLQIFEDSITSDVILYAAEYAPFLEFDTNGGETIAPIMAREGDMLSLPLPTKTNYKFLGWQTQGGEIISSITMPANSTRLVAQWQAMLVFNSNGGLGVESISEAAGTEIELPVTERKGYVFAGWYTENESRYMSTIMPSVAIELKAGWYEEKAVTVTAVSSSKAVRIENTTPSISERCYTFDYNKYFGTQDKVSVRIVLHTKLNTDIAKSRVFVKIYSQKTVSSAYLLAEEEFLVTTSQYKDYCLEASFDVRGDFYICWAAPDAQYFGMRMDDVCLTDFYYTLYYTDKSILIL